MPRPTPVTPSTSTGFASAGTYTPAGQQAQVQGRFGVQLGAFSTLENARDLVAQLKEKGLPAAFIAVTPGAASGGPTYKVVYGAYPQREAARQQQLELKAKGYEGFVVTHL
jgi:cell division septation protein DedD